MPSFLFLKEDSGFIKFLEEYPQEKEFLLTADFLWDFFFVKNEEILLSDPGLSSLLSLWREYESKLDINELRVFKMIMTLFAIKRRGLSETSLLKPSLRVLKVAFSGTQLYNKLEETLERIEKKRAVRLMKEWGDITILEPAYEVDSEEIERIKKEISFKEFVKKRVNFDEEFESLRRAKVFVVTDEEILKSNLPYIEANYYKIPLVIVLLERLDKFSEVTDKVRRFAKEKPGKIFAISRAELGDTWNVIRENLAYYYYYSTIKKTADAKYHENLVISEIKNWKERIKSGELKVLVSLEDSKTYLQEYNVSDFKELEKKFKEFFGKIYPYGYYLENLIQKEPLWKNKNLNSKSIEIGLDLKKIESDRRTSALQPIVKAFAGNIIDDEGNFIESHLDSMKENPLFVMKKEIKKLYENKGQSLDLSDVWLMLQKPPYGLYDCPVGCFVFALLMREYCKGHYAVDQNNYEVELNYDNMAKIINEVIRGTKNWKIQTISKEQRDFCDFLNDVFYLNARRPVDAVQQLREKVTTEFRYPLWMLKFNLDDVSKVSKVTDKAILEDLLEAAKILIDLLDLAIKSPLNESKLEELNKNIKEISKTLNCFDNWEREKLMEIFRELTKRFPEAFSNFVKSHFHETYNITNLTIEVADATLRKRMQEESWLWEEGKIKEMLKQMAHEYKFVNNFGRILGIEANFLDDLRDKLKDKIKKGDFVPLWVFKHELNNEIKRSVLAEIENIILNESIKSFETDIFEKLENIRNVFANPEKVTENWICSVFPEIDEQILYELKREFKSIASNNPQISEEEATRKLKEKLRIIERKVLKEEIKREIQKILFCEDFKEFLRLNEIPIALIKYLPEYRSSKINRNFESFVSDLENLENLTEEGLKRILREIRENEEFIKVLSDPNVGKKALKTFLGEEWYEKLFNDLDLEDLFGYLNEKMGDARKWTEKLITQHYKEWKNERYMEKFYPRVKEFLEKLDYEKIKGLIEKLAENSEIGFKIIEIESCDYDGKI